MLKHALIFSLCVMGVYCAFASEDAPVTDQEKAQGYACKSADPNLGLMKEGEKNTNIRSDSCSRAICNDGTIERTSCGSIGVPDGCEGVSDLTKPYPDCCAKIVC